ncbi:unnamed protein product [Ixodes persulcatus]
MYTNCIMAQLKYTEIKKFSTPTLSSDIHNAPKQERIFGSRYRIYSSPVTGSSRFQRNAFKIGRGVVSPSNDVSSRHNHICSFLKR